MTDDQVGRFQRVLQLLSHLQSGPRSNTIRLAEEFQVSRRTIHRDIKLLQNAGIPVFFDEETDVYRLGSESRFTRPPKMTNEEVGLLVLAAHLSLSKMVPENAAVVRDAISKLLSTFPVGVRTEVGNLLASCCIKIPGLENDFIKTEVVQTIIEAIRKRHQVRITLADKTLEDASTKVAPYRIVVMEKCWLLVGRSSVDRRIKTFNIGVVEKAEPIEDSYTIPKGFRCENYLPDSTSNPCHKPERNPSPSMGYCIPENFDE